MRGLLDTQLVDRLLFTAIALGALLAALGGWRYVDAANQLAGNAAAQIREAGGDVEIESKSQAQGLMAADIERRRLQGEQSNMMVVGGLGLALIGLGWLGYEFLRGRSKQPGDSDQARSPSAS